MPEVVGERVGGRRDAQRNHERLVEAARELFTEQGVEASLEEVARRAGLGIGTLYRHFATRDALVEAIVERRMAELTAIAGAALSEPDGWAGLVRLLEETLELQVGDRMLKDVLMRYSPERSELESAREEVRRLFEQILQRAHNEGSLRPDFVLADLAVLFWSFAPVIDATAAVSPGAWRRHLGWLLDGVRNAAAHPQTEPALTDKELRDSTQSLRQRR